MKGVYAVKHKNPNIINLSRSGGIFTALSDSILERGGVVYGCILNSKHCAEHVRAIDKETRDKMRGSKYIQSSMGDTFKNVRKDLSEEKFVLFTGTPCQIAGLKRFIGENDEKLICVDIVCHGVPSPDVWTKYLQWQERRQKSKVKEIDFRNKKEFGWRAHVETLVFENNRIVNSDIFSKLFYSHNILRPFCYSCPYTNFARQGDITIADYWGIEKNAPIFDDNKGTSLVIVNTDKGSYEFDMVISDLMIQETRIENSMQRPLMEPCKIPSTRDQFWIEYRNRSFTVIAKKYGGYGLINAIKRFIRRLVKRVNE